MFELAGKAAEPKDRYRSYCEEAVRDGLAETPWEQLIGQVVLGTKRFAQRLTAGADAKEWERRRIGGRPTLDEIIVGVEEVRGERWEEFRDRHGDVGRDLVLNLGRRMGGLGIRILAEAVEVEYMSAATAIRRFSERVGNDPKLHSLLELTIRQSKDE